MMTQEELAQIKMAFREVIEEQLEDTPPSVTVRDIDDRVRILLDVALRPINTRLDALDSRTTGYVKHRKEDLARIEDLESTPDQSFEDIDNLLHALNKRVGQLESATIEEWGGSYGLSENPENNT